MIIEVKYLHQFAQRVTKVIHFFNCVIGGLSYHLLALTSKRSAVFLLYDYTGIGDVFVFCLYLKANMARIENGMFTLLVTKPAHIKILRLFEIKNYRLISEKTAERLTYWSLIYPKGDRYVKNITPFPRFNFNDISFRFGGVFLNMADMYKYEFFNLSEDAPLEYPVFKPDTAVVDALFRENNLVSGRTVILSPVANSIPEYGKTLWEKLARELKSAGWTVCTNIAPKSDKSEEHAVQGTIPLVYSFENAEAVLEKAGLFIGLRSGFCDIVCGARCKKIILYPSYRVFNSSLYDFCSFEKMGIGRDIIEIQDFFNDENKLTEKVMREVIK